MRKMILSLVLLGLTLSCGKGFKKEAPTVLRNTESLVGEESLIINERYLALVNQHRSSIGLDILSWNLAIEENAFSHSRGMGLYTRNFGHSGFDIRCRRLRNRLGLSRRTTCGEIIGRGQKDYRDVFHSWLRSPEHRAALENRSYTHTALGIYKSKDGLYYWTQIFVSVQ